MDARRRSKERRDKRRFIALAFTAVPGRLFEEPSSALINRADGLGIANERAIASAICSGDRRPPREVYRPPTGF